MPSASCCHITLLLAVCHLHRSHPGRAEEGVVCVKQEPEEVSGTAFCEMVFCSPCIGLFHVRFNYKDLHFVLYSCPQLINDADYKLSGVSGIGNEAVMKADSLDLPSFNDIKGISTLHLSFSVILI